LPGCKFEAAKDSLFIGVRTAQIKQRVLRLFQGERRLRSDKISICVSWKDTTQDACQRDENEKYAFVTVKFLGLMAKAASVPLPVWLKIPSSAYFMRFF